MYSTTLNNYLDIPLLKIQTRITLNHPEKKTWFCPSNVHLNNQHITSGTMMGVAEGANFLNTNDCGIAGMVTKTGPGSVLTASVCYMANPCNSGMVTGFFASGTGFPSFPSGLCS